MTELTRQIDEAILAATNKPQALYFLRRAREAAEWPSPKEAVDLGSFKNMTPRYFDSDATD